MNWFGGSVADAVNEAKRNGKLFLVYIEGTDEMSKQMSASYDDPAVAQKLSTENIIALKLVANSVPYVQFSSVYPVLVIPSSYFIGVNGTPIEVITGSLLPTDFSAKIDKVLEVFEKSAVKKKSNVAVPSSSESPAPSCSSKEPVSETPSSSEIVDEAESKLTLQEKVERAKALLEAQKQSRELEEKEKEKREELERRSIGKAVQQAEQAKRDIEMREWAKNRAKEKEEERLAREKVKAMIAQDRAERAARYQMTKEAEQAEEERQAKIREEQERAARNAAMNSNEARIQFRLPDGSFTTHSFSADSSLEDARRFVIEEVRPPFSNFSLCTTFPRRHFTESNYSETLRDLQLAPSAVLLVLPAQAVASVNRNASFLSNLFWMLISPLTSVWRLIQSFFPGSSQEPNRPPPEVPRNAQQPSASGNRASDNDRQSAVRRREPTFYKREGNVFRINNQSDEDENNTWNGNSTQQM